MDSPMEALIKAMMMGHPDKAKDPGSRFHTVLEDLKTAAPHLLKSDTYQELKRAELDAAEAQQRYEAAHEMKCVWKDIRRSCHNKDGLQLIDSSYHKEAEKVQAAIMLSEDPVGRLLGLEDCDLDEMFIHDLHHAVLKHLRHRDSRIKRKLKAPKKYLGVGALAEALLAKIHGIKKSIANMRLWQQECLFKLEKTLREITTMRRELPELREKDYSFLQELEEKIIEGLIEIGDVLEEELGRTFADKGGIGKAMEILIRRMKVQLLHKVSEEEKKLQEKEELLDKFEDLWCPEFESMITEYKNLCLLQESVNDANKLAVQK